MQTVYKVIGTLPFVYTAIGLHLVCAAILSHCSVRKPHSSMAQKLLPHSERGTLGGGSWMFPYSAVYPTLRPLHGHAFGFPHPMCVKHRRNTCGVKVHCIPGAL